MPFPLHSLVASFTEVSALLGLTVIGVLLLVFENRRTPKETPILLHTLFSAH